MASLVVPRSVRTERTYERQASTPMPTMMMNRGRTIDEARSGRSAARRGSALSFASTPRPMVLRASRLLLRAVGFGRMGLLQMLRDDLVDVSLRIRLQPDVDFLQNSAALDDDRQPPVVSGRVAHRALEVLDVR